MQNVLVAYSNELTIAMEIIQQLTLISTVLCIPAVRADVVLCMYSNNTNECVDCDLNITITADHDDIIVDADVYASDNITFRLCSPSSLQDLVLIKDIEAVLIFSELYSPVIITCNGRDGAVSKCERNRDGEL